LRTYGRAFPIPNSAFARDGLSDTPYRAAHPQVTRSVETREADCRIAGVKRVPDVLPKRFGHIRDPTLAISPARGPTHSPIPARCSPATWGVRTPLSYSCNSLAESKDHLSEEWGFLKAVPRSARSLKQGLSWTLPQMNCPSRTVNQWGSPNGVARLEIGNQTWSEGRSMEGAYKPCSREGFLPKGAFFHDDWVQQKTSEQGIDRATRGGLCAVRSRSNSPPGKHAGETAPTWGYTLTSRD